MDTISQIYGYLTDPRGLGFPLLISAGLFLIIWLMNKTSKGWKKTDITIEKKKEDRNNFGTPFKPL
jgi:hypothetical protein